MNHILENLDPPLREHEVMMVEDSRNRGNVGPKEWVNTAIVMFGRQIDKIIISRVEEKFG